ncbi:MAG: hypothetical protein HZA50_07780 [Planctomycetes bacterium]|nr:hypothetical protein [Planctomycetota bacterium]
MEEKIPTEAQTAGLIFADEEIGLLVKGALADLAEPMEPRWQAVKTNASRTVYRGRLNGVNVYLKHFHRKSLIYRLTRRIGLSDAMRELRFSRYLAGRGVVTVQALAAMCSGSTEWLLTKAVEPACQADKWHQERLAEGLQGRLAIRKVSIELARMLANLHDAGVVHSDLHCGNVMLRTDGPDAQPVLMDLHRASKRGGLSRKLRAANLAQLLHDRHDFTTRTERLRFLTCYLTACRARGTLRGWQLLIDDFAFSHRRRQFAQRDKRIFGRNRYFSPIRPGGLWRGHVVLASKRRMAGSQAADLQFTLNDWNQALADPQALLTGPNVKVVKDSPSCLVIRRKIQVGPHELDVFVKRYRRKHSWKAAVDCFRPSRAVRAFRVGHEMLTRRIATAMPLAALELRAGPLLKDSILITEAVDGERLHEFLAKWLSSPPQGDAPLSEPQQRRLAQEVLWLLGRLMQQLHDNRYVHRDLKSTNLLICWSPGASPELVLIDLDGLRRTAIMTAKDRLLGLMRLNVSLLKCPVVNRAGRLRMLLGYLRRPGCGTIEFKSYWRLLDEWSGRKLTQQIRSLRLRQKQTRRPD